MFESYPKTKRVLNSPERALRVGTKVQLPGLARAGVYLYRRHPQLKSKVKVPNQSKGMPTAKDPPAVTHHLRIEVADLSPVIESLKVFPWSKAIVSHKDGKSGEHPHLHIFLEFERALTKVAAKDRLRKHNELFKSISGNSSWSFRPHDSYTVWCKYVCKNLSHTIIKGDEELDKIHEEAPKVPIVADSPIRGVAPAKVIVKKRTISEKLISHCESELKWIRDTQFGLESYTAGICQKQVGKALTRFQRGKFNDPQAVCLLRNLLYEFADEDLKEYLDSHYPSAAIKYL